MKVRNTKKKNGIGVIIFITFGAILIIVIIGFGIFIALPKPSFSAKEIYHKALETLKTQGREAVFTKISTGRVPAIINGIHELDGRESDWDICFYSKEEDKFIKFYTRFRYRKMYLQETYYQKLIYEYCRVKTGINISKWKIDS